MLPIDHDTSYVKSVLTAAISPSWKARKRALIFLQVFMFRNLYNVESEREMAVSAVVKLMSDEQLEVRELASVTLGGFVRCGLAPESLLSDFFEMVIILNWLIASIMSMKLGGNPYPQAKAKTRL